MYIARDYNNDLILFENCPFRHEEDGVHEWVDVNWQDTGHAVCCLGRLPKALFPELKWQDEPIKVEIDTRENLIKRFEILHTHYYLDSNKFFDENPGKGFMSFNEYALKNWNNVDMSFFDSIG